MSYFGISETTQAQPSIVTWPFIRSLVESSRTTNSLDGGTCHKSKDVIDDIQMHQSSTIRNETEETQMDWQN